MQEFKVGDKVKIEQAQGEAFGANGKIGIIRQLTTGIEPYHGEGVTFTNGIGDRSSCFVEIVGGNGRPSSGPIWGIGTDFTLKHVTNKFIVISVANNYHYLNPAVSWENSPIDAVRKCFPLESANADYEFYVINADTTETTVFKTIKTTSIDLVEK